MTVYAIHFKRFLSGTASITAVSITVPSGWYSLFDLMATMQAQAATLKLEYHGITNTVLQNNGAVTLSIANSGLAQMLGHSSLTHHASYIPGSTWSPREVDFGREWGVKTAGKNIHDVDARISLDGHVWAICTNAIKNDILRFSLIERNKIIYDTSSVSYTKAWESVWQPHKGIVFLFDEAGTASGLTHKVSTLTAGWNDMQTFTINNPNEVDTSLGHQFADDDSYFTMSIPVIGNGVIKP
jgi:hypothetical protein